MLEEKQSKGLEALGAYVCVHRCVHAHAPESHLPQVDGGGGEWGVGRESKESTGLCDDSQLGLILHAAVYTCDLIPTRTQGVKHETTLETETNYPCNLLSNGSFWALLK